MNSWNPKPWKVCFAHRETAGGQSLRLWILQRFQKLQRLQEVEVWNERWWSRLTAVITRLRSRQQLTHKRLFRDAGQTRTRQEREREHESERQWFCVFEHDGPLERFEKRKEWIKTRDGNVKCWLLNTNAHLILKEALEEVTISPETLFRATHWKVPVSKWRSTAVNFRLLPSWKRRSLSRTARPSCIHEYCTTAGSLTSQPRMALRPWSASWDTGSLVNCKDEACKQTTVRERGREKSFNYYKWYLILRFVMH